MEVAALRSSSNGHTDPDEIKRIEAYDLDMPVDTAPVNKKIAASIQSVPSGVLPKGRGKGKRKRRSARRGI